MIINKIGIIAGNGQFPILFSKAARKKGFEIYAIAHIGETRDDLAEYVNSIEWIHIGQIGRLIKYFHTNEVKQAVMVGAITKTRMFRDVKPDFKAIKLLSTLRHTRDDNLLRAVADYLEKEGITIEASTFLMPELLATEGCWTRRKPRKSERQDIEFGWELARKIGELDIGQCLVVQGRSVLAVEAIDGTDATIRRGGGLGNGQAVLVKICKPRQDRRFDLPAVGIQTIESMHESGVSTLVVEAENAIVFDREETISKANHYGISIIGKKS
ncbi:MAG: UDP-2,3-diacylglucosamine diphosphatase LpxI [Candidatus Magnetomorum sp.]|nr:UDP-2,3-diacylglucosamine diphosphatase LpxI [Candidatus Magnetomorum sp.]